MVNSQDDALTCPGLSQNESYCAGDSLNSNIIIRCDSGKGYASSCSNLLEAVDPPGPKVGALCMSDPSCLAFPCRSARTCEPPKHHSLRLVDSRLTMDFAQATNPHQKLETPTAPGVVSSTPSSRHPSASPVAARAPPPPAVRLRARVRAFRACATRRPRAAAPAPPRPCPSPAAAGARVRPRPPQAARARRPARTTMPHGRLPVPQHRAVGRWPAGHRGHLTRCQRPGRPIRPRCHRRHPRRAHRHLRARRHGRRRWRGGCWPWPWDFVLWASKTGWILIRRCCGVFCWLEGKIPWRSMLGDGRLDGQDMLRLRSLAGASPNLG